MTEDSSKQESPQQVLPRGNRVDYLTIAFKVEISDGALRILRQRAHHAREFGANVAELIIGRLQTKLRASRDRDVDRWKIHNPDTRGNVGLREQGGWTVELHATAQYLATHALRDAIAMLEGVAAEFGPVTDRRIRRLDLAADFSFFPLSDRLSNRWRIPARGRLGDFRPQTEDLDDSDFLPDRRAYHDARGRITGYAICPGGDVSARIYDKSAELELSGREEKRAIERSRWSAHGWDVDAPDQVTRVEFQLRGTALDDLDLRSPYYVCACGARRKGQLVGVCGGGAVCPVECQQPLADRLDAVWRYLTDGWLRLLAEERDGRRSDRVATVPAWMVVQAVTFKHDTSRVDLPAFRVRRRGGATHEQALGAVLSSMSGEQLLPRIAIPRGVSEAEPTAELSKDEAYAWTLSLMLDLYVTTAIHQTRHFWERHGRDAPTTIATRWNAAHARFRSSEDQGMPPRWSAELQTSGPFAGAFVLRDTPSVEGSPVVPLDDSDRRAIIEAG